MNTKDQAHFKALLRRERARIVGVLDAIAAPTLWVDAPGDDGQSGIVGGSPHDDDAVVARETAELADVDAALRLLRDSPERYGRCVTCGRAISAARLSVVPATRTCERHARRPIDSARVRSRASGTG